MTVTKASWVDRKTVDLHGLCVTLSEPVAIGRSHGYFWFGNLWQMPSGDLLSMISPVADGMASIGKCLIS